MVQVGAILERVSKDRDEKEGIEALPGSHEKTIINRGNGCKYGSCG